MPIENLNYATIQELIAGYGSGDLSPVEVTRAHLDAISKRNDDTNDYIRVTADRAIQDAERSEQAYRLGTQGALEGVPVALKDLVETRGIPTTAGTAIWKDHIPDADGTVARKLAEAGAVLLGKTNLVEFAFGPYGLNPHYGTPPNPWNADHVPGGSSSGSGGAVARGCAVAAIGTDTGGSIRLPASFCGIVGLKPTVPRVSRAGVVPLSWTLDSIGPLTRVVEDAAIVFDAIVGADPDDPVTREAPTFVPTTLSLGGDGIGMRAGVVRDPFFDGADPAVVGLVEGALNTLADAGVALEDIDLPEATAELKGRGSASIMSVEGYACHGETLCNFGDVVDPRIKERLEGGSSCTAVDYALALLRRDTARRSAVDRLSGYDAVLAPTALYTAPKIADVSKAPARLTTRLVNYLGLCAVSVPCGFAPDGLPVGLQVIGKPYEEARILRLAHLYESLTDWHTMRPPE